MIKFAVQANLPRKTTIQVESEDASVSFKAGHWSEKCVQEIQKALFNIDPRDVIK